MTDQDDGAVDERRVALGRKLRRLRIRAGLTGPQLAERIGTNQPRVSRIETGARPPKLAVVEAWCDATNASDYARARIVELAEEILAGPKDKDGVFGGEEHHFTITVNLRGHGADWSSDLIPQEIRAYNLHDALQRAAELPLSAWFEAEEEDQ